ncbi:AAA family ATPase [Gordonia neofelifaecis]|uniref:AAA family ATPase n=1 Tax=Gordonia neofelifaecis TaxID=945692 RepID=UPI0005913096|nr:AAA family ATPase [Gordonia neofelifaecis]
MSGGIGARTTEEEVWDLFEQTDTQDEVAFIVAAAMKGDAELATQLGDSAAQQPKPHPGGELRADPVKAYVRSIAVEGFRGIGARATLNVSPRPGITVVSGRNGSGKSSFAEALEFAITGKSYRWSKDKKAAFWKDSWRNKHHGHPCTISLNFVGEPDDLDHDSFAVQVGVKWAADEKDVEAATFWAKLGDGAKTDLDALGWTRPAEIYRPILSYDEVGGLFEDGRSALYDALNKILGLDEIGDAEKRINAECRAAGEDRKAADASLRLLKKSLAACDDPRAAAVLAEVKRRPYDLEVVSAAIAGSSSPQTMVIHALRAFAEQPRVTLDDVVGRTAELRSAHAAVVGGTARVLELLAEKADLLRSARAYVAAAEADDCPVCDRPLPEGWDDRATTTLHESDARLGEHRTALARLVSAKDDAESILGGLATMDVSGIELESHDAYQTAVAAARALPDDSAEWASHLDARMPEVIDAAETLAAESRQRADELEDAWSPVAVEVAAWMRAEKTAREKQGRLDRLTAAKDWLRDQGEVLRERRLEPIESAARDIWALLRQESGVDLGSIALEGSGTSTQRHVSVRGAVDGEETGVLSVMSQGELHALALALFIPRATVGASPFGFLALDDPIQAMDPAKIDGFLTVLEELSKTRQVIVFSHDDRLPAAIRRMSVEADLIEVSREPGSRVIAKRAESPAHRYVDDAFALIVDDGVTDLVKARAAPGLFRLAVEAAARQRFFTESMKEGNAIGTAEKRWSDVRNTGPSVALAVYGDQKRPLGSWVNHRQYRNATLRVCTKGVHNGQILDRGSVRDLRNTVDDILDGR